MPRKDSRAAHASVLAVFDAFRRFGVDPPIYRDAALLVQRMGSRVVLDAVEALGSSEALSIDRLEDELQRRNHREHRVETRMGREKILWRA